MINNGKNFHYLTVTNLSGLLQGNSSNHRGDIYCLNCFNSYTTENKLKEPEEICNNRDDCCIEMPNEPILKYNPGEKSLKAPIIYIFDLECTLKKVESCQNNPEKSYTEKSLYMCLLVGRYIKNLHLMKKKINFTTIEEKIVLKNFLKN